MKGNAILASACSLNAMDVIAFIVKGVEGAGVLRHYLVMKCFVMIALRMMTSEGSAVLVSRYANHI